MFWCDTDLPGAGVGGSESMIDRISIAEHNLPTDHRGLTHPGVKIDRTPSVVVTARYCIEMKASDRSLDLDDGSCLL